MLYITVKKFFLKIRVLVWLRPIFGETTTQLVRDLFSDKAEVVVSGWVPPYRYIHKADGPHLISRVCLLTKGYPTEILYAFIFSAIHAFCTYRE